jgi:hypothetical protein
MTFTLVRHFFSAGGGCKGIKGATCDALTTLFGTFSDFQHARGAQAAVKHEHSLERGIKPLEKVT